MIEIKNISKTYRINKKNQVKALDDVSLKFSNKGLIFITGPSGSGKSTLLNVLGTLDKIDKGSIIVNNKNISKFKNKEIDYYRNTYIGFVFQEYNLLDNFNVKDNVELSLNLRGEKKNKEKVKEVLEIVELSNLENRKINELSGGQKQRVAIARALIKNPNMILADEPTGNLDTKVSEQIMNILKKISSEKLVIVVTHDIELAKKYGDRIIEIKDGKIFEDKVINDFEQKEDDFKLIKSRLSFFKSIRISFSNLRKKKIKLAVIIFLLTISLSVFGFSLFLTSFNINKTHAETMMEYNENRIDIIKQVNGKQYTYFSHIPTFTTDEVNDVLSKLNDNVVIVSKASEDDYLSIQEPRFDFSNRNEDTSAYYGLYTENFMFLEYNDNELDSLKLIGQKPINAHEIIINKVYADYIIKKGVQIVEINDKKEKILSSYNPKSYEEIINDKQEIKFGSTYLIISGIVDDDLSKYEVLKTTEKKEMEINPTKLYNEFYNLYSERLKEVIVGKDFFDSLNLKENTILNIELYKLVYNFDNNKIYPSRNLRLLDDTLTYFNGNKNVVIDKLNTDEIIISTDTLDKLYGGEYYTGLYQKIADENNRYTKLIEERNQKIKEIEKELLNNPDLVIDYPDEITPIDEEKITNQYMIKFLKDNNVLGTSINIDLNDMYLRLSDVKTNNIGEFKVIGINESYDYVSNESLFKKYMLDNKEVISIYFNAENIDEIMDTFNKFSLKDSKFVSKTIYSSVINDVQKVVKHITKISTYAAIVALIFSVILFMYFSLTSISSNKKSIGILRALGAKITDIYKIFYLEVFIMGLFTLISSALICYFGVEYANRYVATDLFINIKPIIFNINIILYLTIIIIALISVSFIIPVLKISKTKPIDVINNK